ncbi:MAG: ECF transporter S component [Firmicutes bacterium]|nr:ECF transporter S component [Bacillota bacterium]
MTTHSLTRSLVIAALMVALGVTLPLAVHLAKIGGPILCPMHIPIFLAGLLLEPGWALVVAVMAPILSFILTGMPPMSPPMLPLMVVELSFYAVSISLLTRHTRYNIWVSLPLSMIIGRIGLGLAAAVIGPLFNFNVNPLVYVYGALIQALPGIALQLLIIPALVKVPSISAQLAYKNR